MAFVSCHVYFVNSCVGLDTAICLFLWAYMNFGLLQPDTITGDIVFVLQQKEHPKFKRKGDDLFVEHTLSLTEALCGFQYVLTHLDGRQLLIKSQPGEVVKPGKRPCGPFGLHENTWCAIAVFSLSLLCILVHDI